MGRLLEQDKVVKAMEQVLDEGKRFDELTKLAEEEVNPQMLGDDDEDVEQEEEGENGNGGGHRSNSRNSRSGRSKSSR